MASWTNEIWQHTETMIEHGTDACFVPKNTLFITCGKTDIAPQPRNSVLRNPGKPYQRFEHGLTSTDVIQKRTGVGMFLYPKKKTFTLMKMSREDLLVTRNNKYRGFLPISSNRPYAEAGRFVVIEMILLSVVIMLLPLYNLSEYHISHCKFEDFIDAV